MTDYDRELSIGERMIVLRGPEPDDGWRNRFLRLEAGDVAKITGGTMPTRRRPRGGSNGGTVPPPEPPPDPEPTPGLVGYGSGVTGGAGGALSTVTNWSQLVSAVAASRPRIIEFAGSSNIDGSGDRLDVDGDDLTFTMDGWGGSIKKGWIRVTGPASNIMFDQMRVRPGDEVDSPDDADAISVNAADGDIDGVVFRKCSLMWGPDIGGLSLITRRSADGGIGDVKNVTAQQCVIGPGLSLSAHSEGTVALGGHAKAANLTNINSDGIADITTISPRIRRVTLYQCIFMGGEERVPQVHYADHVDMVESLVYDWRNKGADGNPNSMNMVGCVVKAGPNLSGTARIFYYHPHPGQIDVPDSLYLADNRAIGFTANDNIPAAVKSGSALNGGLYLVSAPDTAESTATRLTRILANAGPTMRDSIDASLMTKIAAGDSVWYNGAGEAAPNPSWPAP